MKYVHQERYRSARKKYLINARKLLHNTTPNHPNAYTLSPMNNRVVSIVEFSETKTFFGATAYISAHELELDNNQFSTVYPALFGDSRTRLFGYWTDPQTGNWWLITDMTIGYWPKNIFTHLANNALIIRYGGVAGAKAQTPAPPMGNGYLPQLQDYLKTAYMTPTKHDTTLDCYNILFAGNIGGHYEITTAFGGPGGSCP
ncbi:hypothetical protein MKW98_027318 [Papaver atlanticum]|uniref:Neprosin PEP catalytic domain-containing protein n=1 Tax=Papaver atlanticum TaxID=357466 RepID=A0AAD4SR16_9MAGN|nr:hypothetical protein MKW98_027318 [Papaver atlanticum]